MRILEIAMKHLLRLFLPADASIPGNETRFFGPKRKPAYSRFPLWFGLALVGIFLLPEPSYARVYSTRDLKKEGFAGRYKGTARGTLTEYNGTVYIPQAATAPVVQRVPARNRNVAGPDGNLFRLTFSRARGSSRRVKIRGTYSGVSFNPFWGFNTVGRGSYIVTLVKRGSGRSAKVKATVVDRFSESGQVSGFRYNFWSFRAAGLQ